MGGIATMCELRPRQLRAVAWMAGREAEPPYGGILACDTGFGKTYVVAGLLRDHAHLSPTLVVLRKPLMRQWTQALREVGVDDVCVVACKSSASAVEGRAVVLASVGMFYGDVPDALTSRPWGRLIVDEADVLRNKLSVTHRALATKIETHARWAVTATPVGNDVRLADGRALVEFVGLDVGRSMPDADVVQVMREIMYVGCEEDEADCDVRDLKSTSLRVVTARLRADPALRPLEAETCDRCHARLLELRTRETLKSSSSEMELIMRCRMAAVHPAVALAALSADDAGDALAHEAAAAAAALGASASAKLEFLVNDVAEHPDESSIVFYNWNEERRLIEAALAGRGIAVASIHGGLSSEQRECVLMEFDETPPPAALVAQIRCSAYGLNVQRRASRVYIMSPQWNPNDEKQAIARVYRTGQRRAVTVHRLVLEGTIDEELLRRQDVKLDRRRDVMLNDDLRVLLRGDAAS